MILFCGQEYDRPLEDDEKEAIIETSKHINVVRDLLAQFCTVLEGRAKDHDRSKMHDPELPVFAKHTANLKGLTYGSDEYSEQLIAMKPALDHHYSENAHHPEHHEGGVSGMTLLDLVETFMDWRAATERHENGDIFKSIEHNTKRFNLSPQLAAILFNTAVEMEGRNPDEEVQE